MASPCDFGVEARGGSEASNQPFHWTIYRGKSQSLSFQAAKRKANSYNHAEDKERWCKLNRARDVFDKKSLKEFQWPEGMTCPKFALCEKVWAARPDVWNPVAAKGIVYAAKWSQPLRTWIYEVAWYERVKDTPKGSKRNQYMLVTRAFFEESLYKFDDKAKARAILIDTIAKVLTWVADFEDRLHKLRPGDLKTGEGLK